MKPRKRLSYWAFVGVIACAAIPYALPYLKDLVGPWTFGVLGFLGIVAQHIKQEVSNGTEEEQVPPHDP